MDFLIRDILDYINGAVTCAMKDPAATLLVLMVVLLIIITPGRKNVEKVLMVLIISFIYLILTSNVLARTYVYETRKRSFELFTGDMYEMIENILLFFPLGMLMCGLDFSARTVHSFKERKKYHFIRFIISMAFAGVFTCVIELLQYYLRVGVFTVDDILCNTTGAALGYGIVFASVLISRKIKKGKAMAGKEQIDEQRTNA